MINGGRQRDLLVERACTARAARLAGAEHAERFGAFAEQRAARGPILDFGDRDFGMEVLEELADARNYLVWWGQQLGGSLPADPGVVDVVSGAIQRSLGLVALAFEQADQAHELAVAATAARRMEASP